MTDYSEQLERIKRKLPIARETDKDLKVFGASSHKYFLNKPLSKQEVEEFEELHSITLPDCYKSFILNIGNGGIGYEDSGAGPHYGLYPLGSNIDELTLSDTIGHLKNECVIYPKMSDDYWLPLVKELKNDDLSDDEYDTIRGKICGGILPIGNQGCTYLHGIILNGKYKGKIANFESTLFKPQFCFENNFLDWYERWLDEIISGDLITEKTSWFGYLMGGRDTDLLKKFLSSFDLEEKEDCLEGILNKKKVTEITTIASRVQISYNDGVLKDLLIKILCKFSYEQAKPFLIEQAETNLLTTLQTIFYYAREKSHEWVVFIKNNVSRITEVDTFRFCIYLLQEAKNNYQTLILPFVEHPDKEIKETAIHYLGELHK